MHIDIYHPGILNKRLLFIKQEHQCKLKVANNVYVKNIKVLIHFALDSESLKLGQTEEVTLLHSLLFSTV